MDKKKSVLNVSASLIFRLATMVVSILVRRNLILYCGNDVNGLNSLYLSIIGFLAIAELGVGTAISFCMYRPIVDGDHQKVGALYHLFRKLYLLIGGVILAGGLVLTPFVKYFAIDYDLLDINLHSTFVLMLLSVAITYLFGADLSLINAYKNNYITTAIGSGSLLLQYVLQIVVLKVTGSYHGYLFCRIAAALTQWMIARAIVGKQYAPFFKTRSGIDDRTKQELTKSISAMFMHKVGVLFVNTVDSVVIGAFVGVVALGNYTNYTVIQGSMDGMLRLVFASLTSILGHLYAEKAKETVRRYCDTFHLLNFVLGMVFYLGYYAVADSLVALLFSENLVETRNISRMIAVNGFVQYMRCSTHAFRDATGTFYHDRWKPLVEGAVNIVLSIFLVKRIGVTGVIAATVLTNLLICHVVEPYVVYQYAFGVSPFQYYLRNYAMIGIFCLGIIVVDQLFIDVGSLWLEFVCNGFISVGISLAICTVVLLSNRHCSRALLDMLKRR